MQDLTISSKPVGAGHPCLIVAEIAQAHDGSLGTAHAYIDAVAAAGADAIKFQTHIAAAESTPAEPWRVKFSPQDESRYDYWKRMEFTEPQWQGLKQHADDRGLLFLSTPFSIQAVELLQRLDVPAWKVASGELDNPILLEKMAETKKPVLLSSGMSGFADLDAAVNLIRQPDVPVAVFQCTTAYPCPPEKVGLNVIEVLRQRYNCPVGLSDHSGTIHAGLAAVALGVQMLEVHVTFSRDMFGPDVPASVTTSELKQLAEGVRFIERCLASPLDKDTSTSDLLTLRRTFGKSVVAATHLPAGTILRKEHLAVKKPGTGIPARRFNDLVGRRLIRAIDADQQLAERDIGTDTEAAPPKAA